MPYGFRALTLPAVAALCAGAAVGQVGTQLDDVELTGFAATEATTFADFRGRLVLIEYFAYW